jgi:hypothetical protein
MSNPLKSCKENQMGQDIQMRQENIPVITIQTRINRDGHVSSAASSPTSFITNALNKPSSSSYLPSLEFVDAGRRLHVLGFRDL